jgi:putative PIG3 family NAD(P)H quinone oxidoreductase
MAQAPTPTPMAGQVLIEVHCAGVNRPDIMQRQGHYPPPPGASPILGLEVAGTIAALGEGVSDWQVGQPVCALVPGGGYADYCVTPAGQALPIPPGLDMAQAAGLPEVWFTVWANLVELAGLGAGERLLVHGGSSGIGLAALQLARELGAEAVVTVGSQAKARFCVAYGARAAIEYRHEDFAAAIGQLYGDEGVDVVLDMIGAPYLARNVRILRRGGRLVFIAFQQGSRGELDLREILARRLHLTGSAMRPRSIAEKTAIRDALHRRIWPALADGRVRSHVHATFPMDEAGRAHELMERGEHIGKLVLQVRS